MIIDRKKLLSYRCPDCGSIESHQINVFDIKNGKELNKLCSCRKSGVGIHRHASKVYTLNIPCIICGETHIYKLSGKKLWANGINCIICDKTNTEIAYIGEHSLVQRQIANFYKEVDQLADRLGYNDYFFNVRVMLEVLNRIHDLAENRKLICECGCSHVELTLLPDSIKVRCKYCSTHRFVLAKTNKDLLKIKAARDLIIYNETTDNARRYRK